MMGMTVPNSLPEQHKPSSITRRSFIAGAGAATVGLGLYAGTHARHELEISHRTFPIAKLPDAFHGFRRPRLRLTEDMGMAADHFLGDRLDNAAEIEQVAFLRHASVENDLEQEIAQFVA